MSAPEQPDWTAAPCREPGTDGGRFFPKDESPVENVKGIITEEYLARYDSARPYCRRCPLRPACRDWAIAVGAWYGFYGGMTPVERLRYAERHPEIERALPEPVAPDDRLDDLPGLDPRSDRDRARARAADLAYADREEGPRW